MKRKWLACLLAGMMTATTVSPMAVPAVAQEVSIEDTFAEEEEIFEEAVDVDPLEETKQLQAEETGDTSDMQTDIFDVSDEEQEAVWDETVWEAETDLSELMPEKPFPEDTIVEVPDEEEEKPAEEIVTFEDGEEETELSYADITPVGSLHMGSNTISAQHYDEMSQQPTPLMWYALTVNQSGTYHFSQVFEVIVLSEENGETVCRDYYSPYHRNDGEQITLSADTAYYIAFSGSKIYSETDSNPVYTYDVEISYVPQVEKFTLTGCKEAVYAGYRLSDVISSLDFDIRFTDGTVLTEENIKYNVWASPYYSYWYRVTMDNGLVFFVRMIDGEGNLQEQFKFDPYTLQISFDLENFTDPVELRLEPTVLTIHENESMEVNIIRDSISVYFTPEEDGIYTMYSTAEKGTDVRVRDAEGYWVTGNTSGSDGVNFLHRSSLKAGKTYEYEISFKDLSHGIMPITLYKLPKTTGISLPEEELLIEKGYDAEEAIKEQVHFSILYEDNTSITEKNIRNIDRVDYSTASPVFKISMKNGTVLYVRYADADGNAAVFPDEGEYYLDESICFIQMSFDKEFTTKESQKLMVVTPPKITMGLGETTELAVQSVGYFVYFTPEKTGAYTFYASSPYDTHTTLYSYYDEGLVWMRSNDDDGADKNFCLSYILTGGETYAYQVYSRSARGTSADAVSVTLQECPTVTVNAGQSLTVDAVPAGMFAYFTPEITSEYTMTFTTASEASAVLYRYDEDDEELYRRGTGKGQNFSISSELTKGKKYYYLITSKYAGSTDTISLSLQQGSTEEPSTEKPSTGEDGHTHAPVKTEAVAPTCSAPGKSEGSHCSVCGEVIKAQTAIPAAGHKWSAWKDVSEATVLEKAKHARTCSVCGTSETESYGSALPATGKLSAASFPLKLKQKTTKLTVTDMAKGDYVKSWTSGNTALVTVTGKAGGTSTVTANKKKTGTAKITVTLASGKVLTATVKVQKAKVTTKSVKSNVAKKLSLKKGESVTANVLISPISSTDKVKFKTSNKKVVTVTSKGVIKAKKAGKAKITITSGKKKYVINVTVK